MIALNDLGWVKIICLPQNDLGTPEEEREDVEKKVGEALDENFTVLEEKKEKRELMNGGMHVFSSNIFVYS